MPQDGATEQSDVAPDEQSEVAQDEAVEQSEMPQDGDTEPG